MKKTLGIAGLVAAGLAASALAGVGLPEQARGEAGSTRTITVTGTGTVEARPDRAAFSFGVESRGATAREASTANAAAMRRLIEGLREAGVAERDLQTEQVSVWPQGPMSDAKPSGEPAGYTASSSVRVETSVDAASKTVDAATAAGANTLWGPALTRSESHSLEEQALERALADARRKAEALADAANTSLGEVIKIVEGGVVDQPVVYAEAARSQDAAVPVEPGRVETSASLTVTFAIT
ncbi:MAG: SIMPL domain-containing protein [Gaiellaceae bacterium]